MADTYSITSKFRAQVDTTSGPINGETYPDSKPDRNLAGGQSGSLEGEYDGTNTVSYTGVIDTTSVSTGTNYLGGAFRAADLVTVGNAAMVTGVQFVSFQVMSQIGTEGKLSIRVGNLSSGQDIKPLAVGESITIPYSEIPVNSTGGCAAHAYSLGVNETTVRLIMIGT